MALFVYDLSQLNVYDDRFTINCWKVFYKKEVSKETISWYKSPKVTNISSVIAKADFQRFEFGELYTLVKHRKIAISIKSVNWIHTIYDAQFWEHFWPSLKNF